MTTPIGAGAGAGLKVLGSVLGEIFASGDEQAYQQALREAAAQYGNISAPELHALVAQEAGQSASAGAPNDFGNQGGRNAAIQALINEGLAGGNSLDARLTTANAQREAGRATAQSSRSALASAAGRGTAGAASTLQAQLLGGSAGADRAAQVGLQGAVSARQQALQALQQGGVMAGQAEAQDSARDHARRQALDAMAQFNAQQRQQTNQFNSGLVQQGFQNQLSVTDRRSAAAQMRANAARERAERIRKQVQGTGESLGDIAGMF